MQAFDYAVPTSLAQARKLTAERRFQWKAGGLDLLDFLK
jgi:CO/xanthine dehydrogenase FAD-binding subunit